MRLSGTFSPPGDKSISHRIGLFSLLSSGSCLVTGYSDCEDCSSTLKAVESLGVEITHTPEGLLLSGIACEIRAGLNRDIDCGNSGTTIRLLMGILAGLTGKFSLDGDKSLRRRPMDRVAKPLQMMGADIESADGYPPVRIKGCQLNGIEYELPVASAQLKSAILLAGLQASGPTIITEPVASRDHTERLLKFCGADLSQTGTRMTLKPSDLKLPDRYHVPGDASSAAFFISSASLIPDSRIEAEDVLLNPTRCHWLEVLKRMGARVVKKIITGNPEPVGKISCDYAPGLVACEVKADEIPKIVDEVPILALVATQCEGTTIFRDVAELRIKETDRLAAIASELNKMGACIEIKADDLYVTGPTKLHIPDEELESFDDHRIAMTLAIAGLVAGGTARIKNYECTSISYPGFDETLRNLTGMDEQ